MPWFLALLFLIPFSVSADSLSDRVKLLEKQVGDIQRVVETNNRNVAEALATFSQVRSEFQSLKGQLEENRHFFDQYKAESGKFFEDIDHRISGLEDRLSLFAGQLNEFLTTRGTAGGGTKPGTKKENPAATVLYNKGLTAVNNRLYKEAIASFNQFIQQSPKAELADNAQYWIGECYFAQRDFKTAIAEFQKVLEKHPMSPKAAPALLKQGYAFYEMKSYPEAEAFLKKVIAKYPKSTEAGKAEERLRRMGMTATPEKKG
ncbi:MAG: tol-pal system protein YbgF [Deltaproteobacteria bacterium]|nr:tol-pal system protein YbgF [Deltaproteobacteria bacterium]